MDDSGGVDEDRRRLFSGAALGGAAVLGAVVGGTTGSVVASGGWRREALTIDVACVGDTWRDVVPRNPADPADFRLPFSVEGHMYPGGTVSDGFVPTGEGALGTWFCQGWLVLDGGRPEPHSNTRQTYVFGVVREDDLFPANTMSSTGLEGTFLTDQVATRALAGGTGDYMAASGTVRQTRVGFNTTVLDDGTGDNAPNFRFDFDILQPAV